MPPENARIYIIYICVCTNNKVLNIIYLFIHSYIFNY